MLSGELSCTQTGLVIKMLRCFFLISPYKPVLTCQKNCHGETVLFMGHNICFMEK